MFGDGRWEDQAESETAGAWGVMQRKEEYGAGTQYLQACQELESMSSGLQRRQMLGLEQGCQANGDINKVTQLSGPFEKTEDESGRLGCHPTLRPTRRGSFLWLVRIFSIRQIESSRHLQFMESEARPLSETGQVRETVFLTGQKHRPGDWGLNLDSVIN